MSRRSSGLSGSSSAPVIGNGDINFPHPSARQDTLPSKRPRNLPRSISLSNVFDVKGRGENLDPDRLFTTYTISEVKVIQQRLRTDADAKQEELRVMVGERYRDLLQASTSIISIARSSQHVKQALDEILDAASSQEEPPLPHRPSGVGGNDTHLHTLQLLSAHMKLLLDAPEHLWRLLERNKYFPAAWLFLLARVVHRALVRDDDDQEETWSRQGIDVLEQFPLVQRQWEAVSQFRSQIIHKATISLREYTATLESTCATLLTLYLLDSRPLSDTLSVLLGQRSKSLHNTLSWKYDNNSSSSTNDKPNGRAQPFSSDPFSEHCRKPIEEVKSVIHTALDSISHTVRATRSIYEDDAQPSLIRRVLEYIQSGSTLPEQSKQLPPELCLTTQALLTTLPSSTQFLLLPPNLRTYKPYVDLNSSSSSIPHSSFTQKLDEWFRQSCSALHIAVEQWFLNLKSVKEIWSIRSSTKKRISNSGLKLEETSHLMNILDESCRICIVRIWKLKLDNTLKRFEDGLNSAILSLSDPSKSRRIHCSPIDFLFQTPPLPIQSQTIHGQGEASLHKYKHTLQRQIIGRTTLLDDVLATLENCARTIQDDLAHVMAGGDETRVLFQQLTQTYTPDADAFCGSLVQKLELAAERQMDDFSSSVESFVFLARLSEELSSSSLFISSMGCQQFVAKEFREKVVELHDRIVDRWRNSVISRIVDEHHLASRPIHPAFIKHVTPTGPSTELVRSLLSLSSSIQQLGYSRDRLKENCMVWTTFHRFVIALTGAGWEASDVQRLCDLAFLWKFADLHGAKGIELCHLLDERMNEKVQPGTAVGDLKRIATEALARMQTLLATLLPPPSSPAPSSDAPDKFAAVLPYGIPVLDPQFQSALDLAKPTSRFGLLLVGGT